MSAAKTGCAVVVMGVSGSGKTTVAELLAKQLGWRFVEGDRLHPPANVEKMKQGIPLTDADRAPWLDRIGEELKRCRLDRLPSAPLAPLLPIDLLCSHGAILLD